MTKTNNSYSGFSYPKALLEVFSKMEIGETVNRDDLIKSIWKLEPDWFNRRSFDVARTNAIKGTDIKLQSKKRNNNKSRIVWKSILNYLKSLQKSG